MRSAHALLGWQVSVMRERGLPLTFPDGLPGLITVHPSFLLRLPDAGARAREYEHFVADLRQVAKVIPASRLAA